jgi:hypothetical protein
MVTKLLILLLMVATSFAETPPTANVCKWDGATPQLYTWYGTDVCPPNFQLAPNGEDCHDYFAWGVTCGSFCEMRTTFYRSFEEPYFRDFCQPDGKPCHLQDSRDVGLGFTASTNAPFNEDGLDHGVRTLITSLTRSY